MNRRILVVGGVAAGASAATKARRTDEQAEIIVFERGEYVSFANCGLPYYVAQEIVNRDSLILVTPERFKRRHNIDVRIHHEVIAINRAERTVAVRNVKSGATSVERYDALVLAPGAKAIIPDMPMAGAPNVFTMRTIPDMDRVDDFIRAANPRRAAVIGAGYIGLEVAEALMERGIRVTVIEKLNQVLLPLDADMAAVVSEHLRESGVELFLGDGVKSLEGDSGNAHAPGNARTPVSRIVLESGQLVPADLVIMAIGVRPDVALASAAGLALGPAGAIAVNARMQTSDPHIWAAGDAVESTHLVTGRPVWMALAGPANKQGRVAGANAAGGNMRFSGVLGTSIVRFNKLAAAATGLNERTARQAGYDIERALIHANHHAGYYPDARLIAVKVIYERHTGRLLGAQVVGEDGVDKRIDVLATAIAGHMTVDDLTELDLAYAPPFGSARDPVIVAGFVAQSQISGAVEPITSSELHRMLAEKQPLQLIDVRTRGEYREKHIPGSRLIPIDELRDRLSEVDPDRPVVIYCRIGLRGYLASRILRQHGYQVRNLAGGIRSWGFETIEGDAEGLRVQGSAAHGVRSLRLPAEVGLR